MPKRLTILPGTYDHRPGRPMYGGCACGGKARKSLLKLQHGAGIRSNNGYPKVKPLLSLPGQR